MIIITCTFHLFFLVSFTSCLSTLILSKIQIFVSLIFSIGFSFSISLTSVYYFFLFCWIHDLFIYLKIFSNICWDFLFDSWTNKNCAVQYPSVWRFPLHISVINYLFNSMMVRKHTCMVSIKFKVVTWPRIWSTLMTVPYTYESMFWGILFCKWQFDPDSCCFSFGLPYLWPS